MGKVSFYCMCFLAATTLLNAISVERCIELQKALSPIIRHANKTHPQTFHVPMDVKDNCLTSALTCFRTQAHKLKEATGRKAEKEEKVNFERLLKKVKLTKLVEDKDCTPCVSYTAHTPDVYFEKMEALLQKMIFNFGSKSNITSP